MATTDKSQSMFPVGGSIGSDEPPSSGRQHPHRETVAYVPNGTSLFTVSERYRDRELTLPEGVYSFMPVGETPIAERSREFK